MIRSLLGAGVVVLAVATAPVFGADAAATALATKIHAAVGGSEGWAATHHLRFTFAGARTHHWDTWSGAHRLEGTSRDGVRYVVLSNLNSREGRVWLDGVEATGEPAKEWLERAYGAWINDTYWLLVPFKVLDPGVNLARLPDATIDGTTWEVLELTFVGVGLTPGDRYRLYADPKTGLVGRWDYVLESFEPGQAATAWVWSDWREYGRIKLAGGRAMVGADRQLPLGDIAVFDDLSARVYVDPAAVTPGG